MSTDVIVGPCALRIGKYWVGVASGNKYCSKQRRTKQKALDDAEKIERDKRDDGCLCSACGERYRIDIMVPDDLWARIGKVQGPLLCGKCIMSWLEYLARQDDTFASYRLEKIT